MPSSGTIDNGRRLATIDTGAQIADLHPRTLRRAISAGELTGFKFGRALRIDLDELDRWISSKAIPTARSTRRRVA